MNASIRLDGGFAVRPCRVADLAEIGVQISIDAAQTIPSMFTLLMSRDAGKGRRARVKWRRGSQIGPHFWKCRELRTYRQLFAAATLAIENVRNNDLIIDHEIATALGRQDTPFAPAM